jgi:tetratricopeptide (TPR) repeat protein
MVTARKAEVSTAGIARDWVIGALLLLAVVVTYAPARQNDFVSFDDNIYVTDNGPVQHGLSARGVGWAFRAERGGNWHPLTWLSLMADAEWQGVGPAGFHLTNVLLHALNTLLVFWLLRISTGARLPSALVAALFGLHPLHVESVAWVSERKDVLSTFFGLLAMVVYVRWTRRRSARLYAGMLTLFIFSLMSKSMLVTLPALLLLLDLWPLRRLEADPAGGRAAASPLGLLKEKLPLFAASALISLVAIEFQGRSRSLASLEQFSFDTRLANAATATLGYLRKTIWPSDLAFFYPHELPGLLDAHTIASALILLAITVAALYWRRSLPFLAVGWLWYLVTLAPVIGLVQIGEQAMADRYTYFPLIGIFVALVWLARAGLARLGASSDTALLIPFLPILLAAALLTRFQIATWSNDLSLSRHALRVTRDNYVAHQNLGVLYERRGDLERALEHHRAAVRIKPGAERYLNLANAERRAGDLQRAKAGYRAAIEREAGFAAAHYNLATILLAEGAAAESIPHYEAALLSKPDFALAHRGLAAALAREGLHERAAVHEATAERLESR